MDTMPDKILNTRSCLMDNIKRVLTGDEKVVAMSQSGTDFDVGIEMPPIREGDPATVSISIEMSEGETAEMWDRVVDGAADIDDAEQMRKRLLRVLGLVD